MPAGDGDESSLEPSADAGEPSVALSAADGRLKAVLAGGTIRLLSCAWLRAQTDGFILPRHQELLPSDGALLSPEAAALAFSASDRRVGVLSYGWLTRAHPDPGGERAVHVLAYLRSPEGSSFEALFWDYACVPEPDANGYICDADLARQQKAFSHMNELYASAHGTAVIRLTYMPPPRPDLSYNLRPHAERGWCVFETYVAMIVVGTDTKSGRSSSGQTSSGPTVPKLLDAMGGEVPELVAAPTPEEFAARLELATFTVAADVARAKQYYLDYYLENGVGARARLALDGYQQRGQERLRRIRWRVLWIGLPVAFLGLVTYIIKLDGGVTSGLVLLVSGFALFLLALQPTEGFRIRLISAFVSAALAGYGIYFLIKAALTVPGLLGPCVEPVLFVGNGTPSGGSSQDTACEPRPWSYIILTLNGAIVYPVASAYLLLSLHRRALPRAALQRLINTFRVVTTWVAMLDLASGMPESPTRTRTGTGVLTTTTVGCSELSEWL